MSLGLPQQERFSRLPFPIHKVTAKTPEELFEQIPGLRRFFQKPRPAGEIRGQRSYEANYRGIEREDLVRVFKYIVFVYDPETDLTQEFPDEIRPRKEAAAREAGFKRMENGDWPPHVEDIMNLAEPQVTAWILEYLKVRKNSTWMDIKFLEEELDLLARNRVSAIGKGELMKDGHKLTKERSEELALLYKKFYSEHTDLKEKTQKELFPVSPENIFKEMAIPEEIWSIPQEKDVPKEARPH